MLGRIFKRYVPRSDVIFSIKAFFWLTVTKEEIMQVLLVQGSNTMSDTPSFQFSFLYFLSCIPGGMVRDWLHWSCRSPWSIRHPVRPIKKKVGPSKVFLLILDFFHYVSVKIDMINRENHFQKGLHF